ncbi:DNA polymerase III subunit delta [Pseudoprevotella muciniphila]|uniref:DNA polymerase III subunit delta n=1 Tax=Pseudoprevotella muciniphila TaxID=2133944 RepID=A0A5P8E5F4_9BACT|nr:DNA polymerase III subunit delta [Pseudoprevotella muciniphila]QFQ12154.1 DNA polymerase III subunit delta [Pseudoprevotella muciniphila]
MAYSSKKSTAPTPDSIMQDVKAGKVAPIYFLMGEEDFYIDQLENDLVNAFVKPEERDFNMITLFGAETDIDTVMMTARGFPMGAERLVVLVKEAQNLEDFDRLEFYLKKPQPTTVLIMTYRHKKLDKRLKVSTLIGKVGVLYETEKVFENKVPAFIVNYLRRKGLSIDGNAAQLMADHVGTDLSRVVTELDKLSIALPEGEKMVTMDMVMENVGISKEFNNFEFTDAIVTKNALKVFQIAKFFDNNKKAYPIQMLLAILFRLFRQLMLAYYSPDKSERGLAAWLDLNSTYPVRKNILPGMANYKPMKVLNIIAAIRRTDARSKGVGNPFTSDGDLMRELLFFILN